MNSSKPVNPMDLLFTNQFIGIDSINHQKNTDTRDKINLLKTIDQPFPKRLNRNYEPIISETVRDVVKDRYTKRRVTTLCIDSRDRDTIEFPLPNNYNVILGRQFNYLESISIRGIDIGPIKLTNNVLQWSYPFAEEVFQAVIPDGQYRPRELAQAMMNAMNRTTNPLNHRAGNFYVEIDVSRRDISVVNRLEAVEILVAQTIFEEGDDILRAYAFPTPTSYDSSAIYLTANTPIDIVISLLPIIITGFPGTGIGGIPAELFNMTEIWSVEAIGNIVINDHVFIRYKIYPVGVEQPFLASYAENIIFNHAIEDVVVGTTLATQFRGVFLRGNESQARISMGRAIEFAFNLANSPLLEQVFGWTNCLQESVVSYIQQKINGCFVLDSAGYLLAEPYIFLKLVFPSKTQDTIANNLVKTQYNNVAREGDRELMCASKCEVSDNSDLFAKIVLIKDLPIIESSILKFINAPLEKVDILNIRFINQKGCLLNLKCNNTLTLELIEIIDVLKDTNIDSRHGEATVTGLRNPSLRY